MARIQNVKWFKLEGLNTNPKPLTNNYKEVTSVSIQNPQSNPDFVLLGDASGQVYYIAPGKELHIRGDALDHGTNAFLDLSSIFVRMNSGVGFVNFAYLDNW